MQTVSRRLADYNYHLPRELIARRPPPRRDSSRMMVLDRRGRTIQHAHFADLKSFLQEGDLLILNNSRVLPARHVSEDGKLEFLFVEKLGPGRWRTLVKPGRKFRQGQTTSIQNVTVTAGEGFLDGSREVILPEDFDIQRSGAVPLPPYLGRASDEEDDVRYQTIFATEEGSLAAPTAGLHFTPEMLSAVPHTFATLHVGIGTFRPVKTNDISCHQMHPERFALSENAAAAIRSAARRIAIGTTTVRVLEFVHQALGNVEAMESAADLFIYPPFKFCVVDAILTNFHLPNSTLLMLVSAFAGRDFILHAYEEAVAHRYRFFSYGDCMLIF